MHSHGWMISLMTVILIMCSPRVQCEDIITPTLYQTLATNGQDVDTFLFGETVFLVLARSSNTASNGGSIVYRWYPRNQTFIPYQYLDAAWSVKAFMWGTLPVIGLVHPLKNTGVLWQWNAASFSFIRTQTMLVPRANSIDFVTIGKNSFIAIGAYTEETASQVFIFNPASSFLQEYQNFTLSYISDMRFLQLGSNNYLILCSPSQDSTLMLFNTDSAQFTTVQQLPVQALTAHPISFASSQFVIFSGYFTSMPIFTWDTSVMQFRETALLPAFPGSVAHPFVLNEILYVGVPDWFGGDVVSLQAMHPSDNSSMFTEARAIDSTAPYRVKAFTFNDRSYLAVVAFGNTANSTVLQLSVESTGGISAGLLAGITVTLLVAAVLVGLGSKAVWDKRKSFMRYVKLSNFVSIGAQPDDQQAQQSPQEPSPLSPLPLPAPKSKPMTLEDWKRAKVTA